MNSKKIIYLVSSFLFFSSSSYGDTNSSADLTLPTVTAVSINGYTLASGVNFYTYCNADSPGRYGPNSKNCTFTASTDICRQGYVANFIASQAKNDYRLACKLRGYMIEPNIYMNNRGGYDVHFKNAYANFVGDLICDDKPITLNWTITCTR